jgi:hypothetical protein
VNYSAWLLIILLKLILPYIPDLSQHNYMRIIPTTVVVNNTVKAAVPHLSQHNCTGSCWLQILLLGGCCCTMYDIHPITTVRRLLYCKYHCFGCCCFYNRLIYQIYPSTIVRGKSLLVIYTTALTAAAVSTKPFPA